MAFLKTLGRKDPIDDDVLSSHLSSYSLNENCIEFEFQTGQNFYGDLRQTNLVSKIRKIKVRGYKIYIPEESEKEPKIESKGDAALNKADEEMNGIPSFLLVTHVNNFNIQIFQYWGVHQQPANSYLK